ncbi:SH3 domain-containing protein [Hymenobacter oligotrophus]|uniref:SH3 domain-containing protein n=1 Tax=Hymenobacter oligotrophus TaxID=2319843 RepID=A0A3B7R1G2_9BACT|nr:SH3 domain-containing protein [Hymenobacter oligotrophus]
MKISTFCLWLVIVIECIAYGSFAQVYVKGYTRRDGTYVQPHYRTSPNHTVTDNYSYPGNYNPNTGLVTGGRRRTSPPTYVPASTGTSRSSASRSSTTATVRRISSGTYRIQSPMDVPLRAAPAVSSAEIYTCLRNSTVYVIEDVNDIYCKVQAHGYTGYISKGFLIESQVGNTTSPYTYRQPTNSTSTTNKSALTQVTSLYGSFGRETTVVEKSNVKYKYRTHFDSPIGVPLRSAPHIDADQVYLCPLTSIVNVIEDNNPRYYKVSVDGRIGYVAKTLCK